MKIFLLVAAALLIGIIIGNRMAAEGSLPGCGTTQTPAPTPSKGR